MAIYVESHAIMIPNNISKEFPGYACILGNTLEAAGVALSQADCYFEMVRNWFIS